MRSCCGEATYQVVAPAGIGNRNSPSPTSDRITVTLLEDPGVVKSGSWTRDFGMSVGIANRLGQRIDDHVLGKHFGESDRLRRWIRG